MDIIESERCTNVSAVSLYTIILILCGEPLQQFTWSPTIHHFITEECLEILKIKNSVKRSSISKDESKYQPLKA